MKQSDTFNSLRNQDHSASFNELGSWLGQQPKNPQKMNTIYKIAASFTATVMLLIACAVPVETEEEIGYMIRGLVSETPENGKAKLANLSEINLNEVQFSLILHETISEKGEITEAKNLTEVVLLLPEANFGTVETKAIALESILDFTVINILPIQEQVERTLFESALQNTFDIKINPDLTEEQIEVRINAFLHENSSITETVTISEDEEGNKHAVFRISVDGENTFELKRDIEQLYFELTPEEQRNINSQLSPEELQRLKELEVQKLKEASEQEN